MRLPVDRFLPLCAFVLLAACGGGSRTELASRPITSGPAADYPVVLGAPFTIGGVTYTPTDKMNIDEVGYAYAGSNGGTAISAAHRTLPLPSYVEVTSLQSGKTILVRVERRGPMDGDGLVELSPGAIAQLGAESAARTPVRVRRVNPPEPERAALRSGQHAPDRMDTPKSLVAVLLRKLNPSAPPPALPNLASIGTELKGPVVKSSKATATSGPKDSPPKIGSAEARPTASAPTPSPARSVGHEASVIQVGAFASKANAEAAAAKVGGSVSAAGRFWRVRMGPYSASAAITAALAKAKAAGYSDARIQRAD